MDPISDLVRVGTQTDVSALLTRQVDYLKTRGATVVFTSLASHEEPTGIEQQMTSLVDTWILVKTLEGNGEHNRLLYILKSRGIANSNQIREFLLTSEGIELSDVYVGPQRGAHRLCSPGTGGSGTLRWDGTARGTRSA